MQFSTAIVTLAAVVAAAPNAQQAAKLRQDRLELFKNEAQIIHTDAAQAGCNWGKCITALAGETAACGAAAVELGANIFADIACIASVGGAISNAACANCP